MGTEYDQRAVLVTGASTGIGRAAALLLDEAGFRVFASVRQPRDGDALRTGASERLTPVLLDVTDETAIARVRDEIVGAVGEGGLWGLVNNAGISFRAPLEFVPLSEFRKLYDSNLFGLLAVTQALLPLIRRARGRIVNVGSIAATMVTPFHGIYSSAKLAVAGLTDALRLEVRPFGVHVSLMVYGGVQTAIWERGARQTGELAGGFPREFIELYAQRQRKAFDFFYAKGRNGLSPEAAARPILHALTSNRPKRTYVVGRDAKFYNLLDKVLYGRLRDRVILRSIGIDE